MTTPNSTSANGVPSVALAIPAYNEADGIVGFLTELDEVLGAELDAHAFVIVDDTSKDNTVEVLRELGPSLTGELIVVENDINLGHGPSVLKAYHRAIDTGAEWVLQVDGDGQFEGADVAVLLNHGRSGNQIVTGARDRRFDPWYRTVLTTALPFALKLGFGVERRDVNCPFRLYRADVLRKILADVPSDSLTPHVLMTVLEERSGVPTEEVIVRHRPRRGDTEVGTTWGNASNLLIPKRLMKLCGTALGQLVTFRQKNR